MRPGAVSDEAEEKAEVRSWRALPGQLSRQDFTSVPWGLQPGHDAVGSASSAEPSDSWKVCEDSSRAPWAFLF